MLFCTFFSCSINEKKSIEENSVGKQKTAYINNAEIYQLKRIYSKELIYKAIDHISDLKLVKKVGYLDYDKQIDSLTSRNPSIVDSMIDSLYRKDSNLIYKINKWCQTYAIINSVTQFEEVVFLEEILHEIPKTQALVNSFLKIEKQDWGSLSTSQVYQLPYITCDFVSHLDDSERISFYKSFLETLAKIRLG